MEHPRQADLLYCSLEVSQLVSAWGEYINQTYQMIFSNRAPTDCVQYFTGIADTVQNYNYGGQMIQNQN